jgi:hypothetical protein
MDGGCASHVGAGWSDRGDRELRTKAELTMGLVRAKCERLKGGWLGWAVGPYVFYWLCILMFVVFDFDSFLF